MLTIEIKNKYKNTSFGLTVDLLRPLGKYGNAQLLLAVTHPFSAKLKVT